METTFLNTDEIADLLGTTRGNVYCLCRRGRLPFVKQGKSIRFPRLAWDAFVAQQSSAALEALKGGEDHAH